MYETEGHIELEIRQTDRIIQRPMLRGSDRQTDDIKRWRQSRGRNSHRETEMERYRGRRQRNKIEQ